MTGRVAGGLRPAAPPPDPQQPPFSPPSVAPASSPVVTPQALAASPMARHEGNGGTSSSTGDLAARRLMPPPSSRPQIPATSAGADADATPKPTSESSRPRSPRQQLPSAHAPSSRSSSNLALPPRPLKSTATPLSRSQPESPRAQQVSSSPVASRFRAQSEAGGSPPAVAASPAAAQSRVTSPPQRLASSPVVPRKSFDEPASSRPSLFDLGLVTPRSPGAPVLTHARLHLLRGPFSLGFLPRVHTARVVSGCALKTAVSSRSATDAPVWTRHSSEGSPSRDRSQTRENERSQHNEFAVTARPVWSACNNLRSCRQASTARGNAPGARFRESGAAARRSKRRSCSRAPTTTICGSSKISWPSCNGPRYLQTLPPQRVVLWFPERRPSLDV